MHAFNYNYHDGQLTSFSLGPRNEVMLEVCLDPVWNTGKPPTARIRFGAIENFEVVRRFFEGITLPRNEGAFLAEVICINNEQKAKWVLELSEYGKLEILARHCSEL